MRCIIVSSLPGNFDESENIGRSTAPRLRHQRFSHAFQIDTLATIDARSHDLRDGATSKAWTTQDGKVREGKPNTCQSSIAMFGTAYTRSWPPI